VSDEKLWDESPTSRHLQVLYHQTSFQNSIYMQCFQAWFQSNIEVLPLIIREVQNRQPSACFGLFVIFLKLFGIFWRTIWHF